MCEGERSTLSEAADCAAGRGRMPFCVSSSSRHLSIRRRHEHTRNTPPTRVERACARRQRGRSAHAITFEFRSYFIPGTADAGFRITYLSVRWSRFAKISAYIYCTFCATIELRGNEYTHLGLRPWPAGVYVYAPSPSVFTFRVIIKTSLRCVTCHAWHQTERTG